ncbi:sperm microtubule inner protein 6-like [Nyctibius grandis]|uniref:sperm microtubule inner protein 6-like n=1 Tax=Nyctibius grandis TaxID=48427 RepID=UPI0035BC0C8C
MFLFSTKYTTPVSTYTDSYRPPCSVKKIKQDKALELPWKENKSVTQGLTMPPVQNPASQGETEQLIKAVMPAYYRNTSDLAVCWPEKYYLARSRERYHPVLANEDKYITWRTGPCNSTDWNKHSSYLPLLPKETRMDTFLHSTPMPYLPKPACLNKPEREVVIDTLHRVPVYTMTGRGPFQDYYGPCSGRHYCLREMDYNADGTPVIRRHLHALGERAVRSTPCCSYSPRAIFCTSTHRLQPSSPYRSPRWDSSHFSKAGGVQRGSFIIHPEFSSEAYSAP